MGRKVDDVDVDERETLERIGRSLREARTSAGLTMAELARRSGVSQPFISQVERGQFAPSVVTLQRLAEALDTPVSRLLGEAVGSGGQPTVVRAGHGLPVAMSDNSDAPLARLLSSADGELEVQHYLLQPGPITDSWFAHPGEDFCYVMAGCLEVEISPDPPIRLGPGDSLHFRGDAAHTIRAVGDEVTEALVVVVHPDSH